MTWTHSQQRKPKMEPYTVIGKYNDHPEIWTEKVMAQDESSACLVAVTSLISTLGDEEASNLTPLEVFEGHLSGLISANDYTGDEIIEELPIPKEDRHKYKGMNKYLDNLIHDKSIETIKEKNWGKLL